MQHCHLPFWVCLAPSSEELASVASEVPQLWRQLPVKHVSCFKFIQSPASPSCSASQGPGPWGMCLGSWVSMRTLLGYQSSQAASLSHGPSQNPGQHSSDSATDFSTEDPPLGKHPSPTPPPPQEEMELRTEVHPFVQLGRDVKWN